MHEAVLGPIQIFISYQVRNIYKKTSIEKTFLKVKENAPLNTKREKPYLSLDLKIRRVRQMPF